MLRNTQILTSGLRKNKRTSHGKQRGAVQEPTFHSHRHHWCLTVKKSQIKIFSLSSGRMNPGMGPIFPNTNYFCTCLHMISFHPRRLSEAFTEAWKRKLSVYTSTAISAAFLRDSKFIQHWGKSEPLWTKKMIWGHCFQKLYVPSGWPGNLSQHHYVPDEAFLTSSCSILLDAREKMKSQNH